MYISYGTVPPKSYALVGKISKDMNFQSHYEKCKVSPETLKYLRVVLFGAATVQGSLEEAALRLNDQSFHQEEKDWDNTFSKKFRKLSKNWKKHFNST